MAAFDPAALEPAASEPAASEPGPSDLARPSARPPRSLALPGAAFLLVAASGPAPAQQPLCVAEEGVLLAPDGGAGDSLGRAVALDGDRALLGAEAHDGAATDAGAAYVLRHEPAAGAGPGTWVLEAKLVAFDATSRDFFGTSVALDGDTAVVGALQDQLPTAGTGAAYVFRRRGTNWSLEQRLVPPAGDPFDLFGHAVELEGDRLFVTALGDDDVAGESGAVYVYERSGTSWSVAQKLKAPDAGIADTFGYALCVDGDRLAIGAPQDSIPGPLFAGGAYLFERAGGTWTFAQALAASDPAVNNGFGNDVALWGDRLLVAARNGDGPFDDNGVVYAFELAGGAWSEAQRLSASDAATSDRFAECVALEGDLAVVGHRRDDELLDGRGALYFFRHGPGGWAQVAKASASEGAPLDTFGSAVDLDGGVALGGAPGSDLTTTNAGAVFALRTSVADLGTPLCAGDGSGAACPCGNTGDTGAGCGNTFAAGGARLAASGTASVAADGVVLCAQGLPTHAPALFFQGDALVAGGQGQPFGDGLRCATGVVRRLGIRAALPHTANYPTVGADAVSVRGQVPPGGGTRYYQVWYRNAQSTCSGTGFNLTNALELVWQP